VIKTIRNSVAIILLGVAMPATAQSSDGVRSGKITAIHLTDGDNYAFRIYLDGTSFCGTAANWAYMNTDWSNYQATAAILTSAWLAGKNVTIYTAKVGDFCKIAYVTTG
jgi:hypothetical protein